MPGAPPAAPAPAAGNPAPAPAATPAGTIRVVDFEGRNGNWAWLKTASGGQVDAWYGGGGVTGRVGSGKGWTEISRDGWNFWVLTGGSRTGTLLKITGQESQKPVEAESGLARPGGLWAEGNKVYWIETRDAVPGGWSFVPSTGPTSRLRVREGEGPPRDLAEWPGAPAGPGDILGITADTAYVRVRRTLSTEFLRVPLTGGAPVLLGTEGGEQEAVLRNGTLWWTAPSEEAMGGFAQRCVRGANGVTVTDWLPGKGHLMVLNGALRYAFNVLYGIPTGSGAPQAPEFLNRIAGGDIGDDGQTAVELTGPEAPRVARLGKP